MSRQLQCNQCHKPIQDQEVRYQEYRSMYFCSEKCKADFAIEVSKPTLGTFVCYNCRQRIFPGGCHGSYKDICYLCEKPAYSKKILLSRKRKLDREGMRSFEAMLAREIAKERQWL